jgi:hypothetical protein
LRENVLILWKFHEKESNVVTGIPSVGWQLYVSGCIKLGQRQFQSAREDFQKAKDLFPPAEQGVIACLIAEADKSSQELENRTIKR